MPWDIDMCFSNYFDIVPTIMGCRDIGSLRQTHFPDVFQQNKLDVSPHVHIIYMCVYVFHAFFSIEKLHVYGLYGMWNNHERSLISQEMPCSSTTPGTEVVKSMPMPSRAMWKPSAQRWILWVAGVANGKWRLGRDGKMGMVSLWFLKQIQEGLALMNTDEQMCSTFLGMEAGNFRRKNLRCHD